MATTEKPVISKYKDRMDKAVAALQDEFGSLRTGRASSSLLDQIRVDAYGSLTPLNQVGAVSVPEPRMITINVWDRALAHKYAEHGRVAIRNVRRDANDDCRKAQKDGVISQDEEKRMEADVQKITDEAIKRVDEALKTKEQEIMHV